MFELMTQCDIVYINTMNITELVWRLKRVRIVLPMHKNSYPAHAVAKSNPILQRLRSVKDPIELEVMQRACDITEKGFRESWSL